MKLPSTTKSIAIRNMAGMAIIATSLLSLLQPAFAAAPYVTVAPGLLHACALGQDSSLDCESVLFARRLLPTGETTGFKDVVAGAAHTCAVRTDETVVCWGDNGFGQLDVPELQLPVLDINAGVNHTCVIDAAGAVQCWGLADNGRLELAYPSSNYTAISVLQGLGCVIDAAAMPHCAIGSVGLRDSEPPATLGPVTQVEVFSDEIDTFSLMCAIDFDGDVTCWGDNTLRSFEPFAAGPYKDIAINQAAVCALPQSGALECKTFRGGSVTSQVFFAELPQGTDYQSVEAGHGGQMCLIDAASDVLCWGLDRDNAPFAEGELPQSTVLSAAVYSETTVELLWNQTGSRPFGARYEIFRNGELLIITNNSSSYIDNTLVPGEGYEYSVVHLSNDGDRSEPSNTIMVNGGGTETPNPDSYTPPERSLATTGLRAELYGEDTVELFWNRVQSGVFGYEISKNGEYIGFSNGTSFIDTVSAGDVADYDVVAVDRDGAMLGYASIVVPVGEGVCI